VRTLLAIAAKDAKVIARDKTAVLIMLAMPLGLIFILGSALGGLDTGDTLDAKVAIVNLDEGDTGALFVDGLTGSEEVSALFNMDVRTDAEAVRRDVEQGDLQAALIIPADLTEKIAAGEPVSLEVLQDPGSQVSAGVWASVVRAAVSSASAQIVAGRTLGELAAEAAAGTGAQTAPGAGTAAPSGTTAAPSAPTDLSALGLTLTTVTVTDAEATIEKRVSTLSYYAAGMTGMFLLFGGMFGAFAFIKERREQTLARVLATPASRFAIMGGKAFGIFVLGVGQFLVLLVGTMLLFRVDWGTNIPATIAVGCAEAFAAAGMATTLAALGKTERAVGGIGPALIMFFAATGGSMIPAELLPAWLLPLQVISPVYWTVGALLDLMGGAGFSAVLVPIAAVLGIGAVLFGFGLWRLKYE